MFESRALQWNNPQVIKYLKDNFVPVAYTGMLPHQGPYVLSPDGKELGQDHYVMPALQKGLAAWRKLPMASRQLDPETLPRLEMFEEPPQPPAGIVILRSYARGLQRDTQGNLSPCRRYQVAGGGHSYPAEPQLDFVWLTGAEAAGLLPAGAKVGDKIPVAAPIFHRLATFHLIDRALGMPAFWDTLSGEITLTVTAAAPECIRARLDGKALVGKKDGGYPITLLGQLDFDRQKKSFSRFDVLALGADNGEQRPPAQRDGQRSISYEVRKGSVPVMAITFELVKGNTPMERVPPYPILYNSAKNFNQPYLTGEN